MITDAGRWLASDLLCRGRGGLMTNRPLELDLYLVGSLDESNELGGFDAEIRHLEWRSADYLHPLVPVLFSEGKDVHRH